MKNMNKAEPCIQRCLKNGHSALNLSHIQLKALILSEIEALSLAHVVKLHLNDNELGLVCLSAFCTPKFYIHRPILVLILCFLA